MTSHPEDKFLELSLLERYCSGTASVEERAQIDTWFSAHPERRARYEQLRERLRKGSFTPFSPEEYQSAWAETLQVALQRSTGTEPRRLRVSRHKTGGFLGQTLRRGVWYSLVGAVLGVLAIVAGWHIGTPRFHEHGTLHVLTYVTTNGERANIVLPDGGTVALDVASRLEVPVDYLTGKRTLRLQGEALFTVPHHDGTPFTVITSSATTRVLGTSFLVRHYATDSLTTVVVRDGKVGVHSAEFRPVVLTAGQQIHIGQMTSSGIQVADPAQFSFAAGILTFKDVPFPEAIAELDRWYDADIRLGDPLLRAQRLTGECAAGSLVELVEILHETFNVRVVRNGRVLTLFPR